LNAFSVDDSQQLNKEEPSKEALNKKEFNKFKENVIKRLSAKKCLSCLNALASMIWDFVVFCMMSRLV
jgi:RecB family exonuclease